ncbi:MAG: nucleotidyltransferase [Planctomycetes bacterium]|nr:nucleotidyltransferase [Planctomycetota bacterium]
MTADEYVGSIISKYKMIPLVSSLVASNVRQLISPMIREWGGVYLLDISLSGSCAKGTAVKGSTDVDLFISLSSNTPGTLKDIYDNLYDYLEGKRYSPRRQNVSIGIKHSTLSVDLIPARKQSGNTNNHSLWKNKKKTWTQTNIQRHIDKVKNSDRIDEIVATKIWRNLNGLDFPSFYLELSVLNALYNKNIGQIANNFLTVLQYLKDDLTGTQVVDPANSANIISDDLTLLEKLKISNAAGNSLLSANWGRIIY